MTGSGLVELGAIFDGEAMRAGPTAIRIEDGCIAAIGDPAAFPADEPRILRLPAATAVPGMIDTHVHLELSGAEERELVRADFEADRAADRLTDRVQANAAAALATGVTTVRDCGSTTALLDLRDRFNRGATGDGGPPSPRIVATGPPLTTRGGQLWWMGTVVPAEADLGAVAAAALDAGADALKVMASGGLLTPESDPSRPQFTAAELRAVVEAAWSRDRYVVAHATAAAATIAAAEAGVAAIDHAGWLAPGGDDGWTDAGAARVARSSATVGFTAGGRLRRLLGQPDGAVAIRRQAARHRRLAELGVRLGVHSDAGGSQTPFDGLVDSLRVAAVGLDRGPLEVLRMATAQAAAELGLADEVGLIRPGRRADLLIVNGDPGEDLAALHAVVAVVRDGVIVPPRPAAIGGTSR